MNTVRSLAALAFTALGAATVHAPSQAAGAAAPAPRAAAASEYRVGDKLAPAVPTPKPKAAAKGEYTLTNWDALVPKDWDPMKDFKNLNFGLLQDGEQDGMGQHISPPN